MRRNHTKEDAAGMLVEQPRLGKTGVTALVILCNMLAPLSTDMYMPALPEMRNAFATTDAVMNFTLVGFFLFFAVGMLVFGPVSDRYGRRPLLVLGCIVYAVGGLACAVVPTIEALIAARIVQALGAGCMVSVSMAVVKDQFTVDVQVSVLSIAQILSVLGPIVAPLLGTVVYSLFGWRAIFVVLTASGIGILAIVLMLRETLPESGRLDGGVVQSLGRLFVVGRDVSFMLFLLAMALLQLPMMAYVSSSSYVYQEFFGLDPAHYTMYFAGAALVSVIGPVVYARLKAVSVRVIAVAMVALVGACGIGVLAVGHAAPIVFAVFACLFQMSAAASRPFGAAVLLGMRDGDTGSASALINFTCTLAGALGMFMITGLWSDYIFGLGVLLVSCAVISALLLVLLRARKGNRLL